MKAGYSADLHFLNMRFATLMGLKLYERITGRAHLHPEWFFSTALFGDLGTREIKNSWNIIKSDLSLAEMKNSLLDAVNDSEDLCQQITALVPRFIDDCLSSIEWHKYRVVGFTTTFCTVPVFPAPRKTNQGEMPGREDRLRGSECRFRNGG